jgi:hypothetical protein
MYRFQFIKLVQLKIISRFFFTAKNAKFRFFVREVLQFLDWGARVLALLVIVRAQVQNLTSPTNLENILF